MKTRYVSLLFLVSGLSPLWSQDLAVKCKVDGLGGKVPLSLAHIWGQKITMDGQTMPMELVQFEFANQTDHQRTLQVGLRLVGLGEPSMRTVSLGPNEKKKFAASPVVDPKLVASVEDERVGKLQI